jgi:hypothetical protein
MGADHIRLDALRRLAKDRAGTPAEKATARRLAKALAAKIGKRPRQSWRKGHAPALPESAAGRWRRIWGNRLDGALHWAEWLRMVTMPLVLVLLFLPTAAIAIDFVTGHKLIRGSTSSPSSSSNMAYYLPSPCWRASFSGRSSSRVGGLEPGTASG